jgi:hypothetical protein
VTEEPVIALNPAAGAQVYVLAPLAVNATPAPPAQIVADEGVTVIVGVGLMVTTTDAILEHEPMVPVTVYKVVIPGAAFTVAPLMELNPMAGDHK